MEVFFLPPQRKCQKFMTKSTAQSFQLASVFCLQSSSIKKFSDLFFVKIVSENFTLTENWNLKSWGKMLADKTFSEPPKLEENEKHQTGKMISPFKLLFRRFSAKLVFELLQSEKSERELMKFWNSLHRKIFLTFPTFQVQHFIIAKKKFCARKRKTHNFSIFQLLRYGIICIHIPHLLLVVVVVATKHNSGNRLNNLCNAFITKNKIFYVLLIFIAFRLDWYWISNYKALWQRQRQQRNQCGVVFLREWTWYERNFSK